MEEHRIDRKRHERDTYERGGETLVFMYVHFYLSQNLNELN